MKIDARNLARVLNDPGAWRILLLHGEDTGLIKERAQNAVIKIAGSADDPFRVAVLDRESHDKLMEEATALSLMGGRRVVRVRDASDALLKPLEAFLAQNSDTLVILEAPGLSSRSKLRSFLEKHAHCASIGCYPEEGRNLESSITRMLAEHNVRIASDALHWLSSRLGADRAAARSEIEKLSLYAGDTGTLSLDDVRASSGDAGSVSLEDAAFAATEGNRIAADTALERALGEDTSPIAIARSFLTHLHRLRRVKAAMAAGISRSDAIKMLRPPVFFKRTSSFNRALELWSLLALTKAVEETQALEYACKQTGSPDALLCRRYVSTLTARAAMQARR
ncbi:DNA polymerase III subunit delta [Acetobacter pomorum]|uniref:DNA polymerase III subunit delta n=1 Tax=Acetobacter pomorum TaxID=65959 RepID=A0A2G4RBH6_9PROT|nr:DNA polymerase III subunit delta [Acetobacter pomorum]PHY93924.1 DNA polymerase III subunit delta [Acetobacter pomorum]GBR45763.1 DNA polymerase III subunit delta [Acetobacter pomorum DSM 11825]